MNEILNNPRGKLIAVDLDGTLCFGAYWGDGKHPKPNLPRIEKVNSLYKQGALIVIYTARYPEWAVETYAWLDMNGVMYHGLMMRRKPGADLYIDDKAVGAEVLDDIK